MSEADYMDGFYPLGQTCVYCGKELEAMAAPRKHAVSLEGLRNLLFRHVDGTTQCPSGKTPSAWDGWSATRAFNRKEARR